MVVEVMDRHVDVGIIRDTKSGVPAVIAEVKAGLSSEVQVGYDLGGVLQMVREK